MNRDQSTTHATIHAAVDANHRSVERDELTPGQRTRSAQLARRALPVASGMVQRRRDANGVAADAEAAVGAAASSSGHGLPATLQRKFEASLGADLSSVRVHTGAESANAAHAVGAKAYTVGSDIHFGAGHYDPGSRAGEHLLAHEIAHTVQQAGASPHRQHKLEVSSPDDAAEVEADRAADAMIMGRSTSLSQTAGLNRQVVQRDDNWLPEGGAASLGQPDMAPLDWNADVGAIVHDEKSPPATRTVNLGAAPPPKPAATKPPATQPPSPNCHTENQSNSAQQMIEQLEQQRLQQLIADRARKWAAYEAVVLEAVGSYNTAVPLVTAYQSAAQDPALQTVDKFAPPGADDNLQMAANKQKVGPANTAVGDLFQNTKVAGSNKSISTGTDVELGAKGDKAVADVGGKNNDAIRNAKAAVAQAEGQAQVAFGEVNGIMGDIKAASEDLITSIGKVEKLEVEGEVDENKERVDSIEEDKAGAIEKLHQVSAVIEGIGAVLRATGDVIEENPVGGAGYAAEGVAKSYEVIGEQIINSRFEAQLGAAKAAYTASRRKLFKSKRSVAESSLTASETRLETAANRYTQVFLVKLNLALQARRTAYQNLATAVGKAATASGADQATANRMAAAVAAIPVVQAVLGRLKAVQAALHAPPGSNEARIGYHMAKASNDRSVGVFLTSLGDIVGYRLEYADKVQFWETRHTSLQTMVTQLGNG